MRFAFDVARRVPHDVHVPAIVGGDTVAVHAFEVLTDRALRLEGASGAAHPRVPHRCGLHDAVFDGRRRVPCGVDPAVAADGELPAADRTSGKHGGGLAVDTNGTGKRRFTRIAPHVVEIAVT